MYSRCGGNSNIHVYLKNCVYLKNGVYLKNAVDIRKYANTMAAAGGRQGSGAPDVAADGLDHVGGY
jgi:hypothetical protein